MRETQNESAQPAVKRNSLVGNRSHHLDGQPKRLIGIVRSGDVNEVRIPSCFFDGHGVFFRVHLFAVDKNTKQIRTGRDVDLQPLPLARLQPVPATVSGREFPPGDDLNERPHHNRLDDFLNFVLRRVDFDADRILNVVAVGECSGLRQETQFANVDHLQAVVQFRGGHGKSPIFLHDDFAEHIGKLDRGVRIVLCQAENPERLNRRRCGSGFGFRSGFAFGGFRFEIPRHLKPLPADHVPLHCDGPRHPAVFRFLGFHFLLDGRGRATFQRRDLRVFRERFRHGKAERVNARVLNVVGQLSFDFDDFFFHGRGRADAGRQPGRATQRPDRDLDGTTVERPGRRNPLALDSASCCQRHRLSSDDGLLISDDLQSFLGDKLHLRGFAFDPDRLGNGQRKFDRLQRFFKAGVSFNLNLDRRIGCGFSMQHDAKNSGRVALNVVLTHGRITTSRTPLLCHIDRCDFENLVLDQERQLKILEHQLQGALKADSRNLEIDGLVAGNPRIIEGNLLNNDWNVVSLCKDLHRIDQRSVTEQRGRLVRQCCGDPSFLRIRRVELKIA